VITRRRLLAALPILAGAVAAFPAALRAAAPVATVARRRLPLLPPPPDVTAPPPGVETTASGLSFLVLAPGAGSTRPAADALARIHYTLWTGSGAMVDSSVAKGKPLVVPVDRVIPGLSEGLRAMVVGERRRLWVPGALAYDPTPRRDVPRGPLVFDVELLEILPPPRRRVARSRRPRPAA
jgi:peptidylprolyl isomerase